METLTEIETEVKVQVLLRRGVELCFVRFEILVGLPERDERYMGWEFTREERTGDVDLGVIRVAAEGMNIVETIQGE